MALIVTENSGTQYFDQWQCDPSYPGLQIRPMAKYIFYDSWKKSQTSDILSSQIVVRAHQALVSKALSGIEM